MSTPTSNRFSARRQAAAGPPEKADEGIAMLGVYWKRAKKE